jgi:putative PIN family toxin of toxin-antitoxin system
VLRAVIDVNVLVSGLLRPGSASPPARIRHALTTGTIRAVASPDLVSELDEVLHRRKLARYLSTADADRAVTEFRRTAEMHYPEEAPTPITRDPDDDYLVALTRYAKADLLVTGDTDLLDLADPGIRIVRPADLMAELDRDASN